jgi:hypothetical protein
MTASTLELALTYEHRRIRELAEPAHAPASISPARRHETDWFYAITSQHLCAAEDVLLPAIRDLPGGRAKITAYLANARELERSLRFLKGRIYGDSRVLHLRRDELWAEIDRLLAEHEGMETDLAKELSEQRDDVSELTQRLQDAEEKAPTRAHPNSPHTGAAGRLAHRMWRLADTAWDSAEGRVVPTRYREHPKHDSALSHYLRGTPIEQPEAEPGTPEPD